MKLKRGDRNDPPCKGPTLKTTERHNDFTRVPLPTRICLLYLFVKTGVTLLQTRKERKKNRRKTYINNLWIQSVILPSVLSLSDCPLCFGQLSFKCYVPLSVLTLHRSPVRHLCRGPYVLQPLTLPIVLQKDQDYLQYPCRIYRKCGRCLQK